MDLFAGAGGWSEGMRLIGGPADLGVEWDADACATAVAAGHERLQADVSRLEPIDACGLIASPPCTMFSSAGPRTGTRVLHLLVDGVQRVFRGEDCLAEVYSSVLTIFSAAVRGVHPDWPDAKIADKAEVGARNACLVLEPARWIAGMPLLRWVAFEQVPQVLPVWQAYAHCLRQAGFSVWVQVLNAADYGVPQTRKRACLAASRDRVVAPPAITHAQRPKPSLFGDLLPWVTMSDALGWGDEARPAATVNAGGTGAGGAEPFGNAAYRKRLTEIITNQKSQGVYYRRNVERPAPTLTSNTGLWRFVSSSQQNATIREPSQPAPTIMFGNDKAHWSFSEPTTTVAGERQHEPSVRVAVTEAAILQGFRPDYPWAGSETSRFKQIGNAVPPPLAAAVLGNLIGKEEACHL